LILTVFFSFYCCLLLILSFFKSAELFLPAIYQLEALLGGDKLMHFKLSILLSLLACAGALKLKLWGDLKRGWKFFLIQLVLMMALLLDESFQYFASTRRFEWLDYLYGISGLFIGLVLYNFVPVLKYWYGCLIRR
jgi:VanZ family protein